MPETLQRSRIDDLIGLKFEEHGRFGRTEGIDCHGLVVEVYSRLGIDFPDPEEGWREWKGGVDPITPRLRSLEEAGWKSVPIEEVREWDLLVLLWERQDAPDHLAVAMGEGLMLHAAQGAGVILSRIGASRRLGRVLSVYRPPIPQDRPGSIGPSGGPEGRALAGVAIPAAGNPILAPSKGEILVVLIEDPLRAPHARKLVRLPVSFCPSPCRARDLIPIPWKGVTGWVVVPRINGMEVSLDAWVSGGDILLLMRLPGAGEEPLTKGAVIAIQLIVAAISIALTTLLTPGAPKPGRAGDQSSPGFDLRGIRNTALNGVAIPVLYGERTVGGNIIQAFFDVLVDGRQQLHVLLAISHGPIHSIGGIAQDSDGLTGPGIPADFKINGAPASQFGNVQVSIRLGSEVQTPIPGFTDLINAVPFEKTLLQNDPHVHQTTQAIDAFEVQVYFPDGQFDITPNGNVGNQTVWWTIEWRVTGTTTWTAQNGQWDGHIRGPTSHEFRKDNLARAKYDIRITRTAPIWPPDAPDKESKSVLIAVNEITYDALAYPGIAVIGWKITSTEQIGQSVPTFTVKAKGRKVWTWNGTYSQAGQPQFINGEEVWSQSPAWCAADMLTHPIYGLGRNGNLTIDNLDLEFFDAWADNSDLLVADGRGGTVKRALFDMIYDVNRDGWEAIVAMSRSAWANLFPVGRVITGYVEKARSPVALFGMGNVKDWGQKSVSLRTRPNLVTADYRNSETGFSEDQATAPRSGADPTTPVIVERLSLEGVTRAAQAYRYAQFRYLWAQNRGRVQKFKAGVEAIHLLPGDTFRSSHDAVQWGTSGRITAATSTTVTLDKDVVLSGTNRVGVRTSLTGVDVLQERTPTNGTYPAGTPITITAAWTVGDVPQAGDPFSIGDVTTYYREFEVLKVSTAIDLSREIEALIYAVTIYSDDFGILETFTEDMPDPTTLPDPISAVVISEHPIMAQDGTATPLLEVRVTKTDQAKAVDIYFRPRADDPELPTDVAGWIYAGRTLGDSLLLPIQGKDETIQVSVVAVAPGGARLPAHLGTMAYFSPRGRLYVRPTDPVSAGVSITQVGEALLLVLPKSSDADFLCYEVRFGMFWLGSYLLGRFDPGSWMLPLITDAATETDILVRTVNRSQQVAAADVTLGFLAAIPPWLASISATSQATGWAGTKVNMTTSGGSLVFSGSHLTGDDTTGTITITQQSVRILVFLDTSLQNKEIIGDDAGFRGDNPIYSSKTIDTLYYRGFENCDVLRIQDCEFPGDGMLAGLIDGKGPKDIIPLCEPVITFRTRTSGVWSSWAPYVPSTKTISDIEVKVDFKRPHLNYELAAKDLRICLLAVSADAMPISDPNSHYQNTSNTVGSAIEELGFVLAEDTRRWTEDWNRTSSWHQGGSTYNSTIGVGVRRCAASADTTIRFTVMQVPVWYLKDGSNVLYVDVYWAMTTVPASDKTWRLQVGHVSFDVNEVMPALSYTYLNVSAVASGATTKIYKATLSVTTPDLGAADQFVKLIIKRIGTDAANDTLTGSNVDIVDIVIRSGVKNT